MQILFGTITFFLHFRDLDTRHKIYLHDIKHDLYKIIKSCFLRPEAMLAIYLDLIF